MEIILVGVAAAALLMLLSGLLATSRTSGKEPSSFALPPGVTLAPVPLFTEEELLVYNLMRMAVRDHYLVFAHIPLWSFVSIEAMSKSRFQVLRQMAITRVDFVLVHPGSREVVQVVQIERESSGPREARRQRVVESVLDAAGIKLVRIRSKRSYTVPDLSALLGLGAEE